MGLGRPCLLLKERRLKALPTDLCGHLYKEFDSRAIVPTVGGRVREWLQEIGLRKRDGEMLIAFVSIGGTCRCAIAKAITRGLLRRQKMAAHVRVESRGMQRPSLGSATTSGRRAVAAALGEDSLADHRPRNAGVCFLKDADLILAMDTYVLDEIQNVHLEYRGTAEEKTAIRDDIVGKSFLVTEFFGSSGNIRDPYPDDEDEESQQRYEGCVKTLRELIEPNMDRLWAYLRDKRPLNRAGNSRSSATQA